MELLVVVAVEVKELVDLVEMLAPVVVEKVVLQETLFLAREMTLKTAPVVAVAVAVVDKVEKVVMVLMVEEAFLL